MFEVGNSHIRDLICERSRSMLSARCPSLNGIAVWTHSELLSCACPGNRQCICHSSMELPWALLLSREELESSVNYRMLQLTKPEWLKAAMTSWPVLQIGNSCHSDTTFTGEATGEPLYQAWDPNWGSWACQLLSHPLSLNTSWGSVVPLQSALWKTVVYSKCDKHYAGEIWTSNRI